MTSEINEPVSVVMLFETGSTPSGKSKYTATPNKATQSILNMPHKIKWQNRIYEIKSIGFHHTVMRGNTLHHIYSVVGDHVCFLLEFDTKSLNWTLVEISDDFAN